MTTRDPRTLPRQRVTPKGAHAVKPFPVRLPPNVREVAQDIADSRDVPLARFVREAVEEKIDRETAGGVL